MRRLFNRLYAATRRGAGHSRAPWLMTGLSFAGSPFSPVPPAVLRASMVLVREPWLRTYIDRIGWIIIAGLMLVMVYLRL